MDTGINRIRKVVAIIGGTLAIILMVFALCKKVGICAEAVPVTKLPFPIGAGYFNTLTEEEITDIVAVCEQDRISLNSTSYPEITYILLRENGTNTIEVYCYYDDRQANYRGFIREDGTNTDFPLTGSFGFSWNPAPTNNRARRIVINKSNLSLNLATWQNYAAVSLSANTLTKEVNGQYVSVTNQNVISTPIYINQDLVYNGTTYFTNKIPSQHNKGGVIADIIENDEIAEEELPQIDITPPTDTTNNSAWYQKILSAIGGIGQRIQSNTITTGNYLEQILTGQRSFYTDILAVIGQGIPSVIEKLDDILGVTREIAEANDPGQLQEDWINGYNESDVKALVTTGQGYKATLSNIGARNTGALTFGSWRLQYIGNDLHLIGNYNMPEIFGGGTHQQDISFSWYNDIRTWFVNIFKVLLFVGFAWYLFTQIPAWISGTASEFKKQGEKTK